MARHRVYSAAALLTLTLTGAGLLGILRPRCHRTGSLPSGSPPAQPTSRSAMPFEEQLRAAADWDRRARDEVNEERERMERWDPSTSEWVNGDAWRRQRMAEDRAGYLGRARRAALRAAELARSREERYRAAALLILIEHEAGFHGAELRYARLLVSLQPRSPEARGLLQRARRCAPGTRQRRSIAARPVANSCRRTTAATSGRRWLPSGARRAWPGAPGSDAEPKRNGGSERARFDPSRFPHTSRVH